MRLSGAIQRMFGKAASAPAWRPEPERDDSWERVKRGSNAQRHGRVHAPLRNTHQGIDINHENRAGHRHYVRVMQTRQVRKNIIGFGRWRRHNESTEPSTAALTATIPVAPRAVRRLASRAAYRAERNARLGRLGRS